MVDARGAELEPPQEVALRDARAVLIHHRMAVEARELQRGTEPAFKAHDVALELFDQVGCARLLGRAWPIVIEHQFHELLFRQHRREVGRGNDEIALVHRPQPLK